jgi:hypothetical protein
VIGDDLVPGGVVGLDEHGTVAHAAEAGAEMPAASVRSGG